LVPGHDLQRTSPVRKVHRGQLNHQPVLRILALKPKESQHWTANIRRLQRSYCTEVNAPEREPFELLAQFPAVEFSVISPHL
jgi:hypothetical protein